MKKPLILAALLSASAALAACDRSDDPANMTGSPAATDNTMTMPSPAPETAAPMGGSTGASPAAGTGVGGGTGTMGQ